MPYESYRGVSNHRPLTRNERIALFGLSTLYFPISIYRGAGLAKAVSWKLGRLGGIIRLGFSDSPGGGGPGLSPISTNPPPSVEATGASLAQHGKTEGPARSSKRGSRPRRRCKPGYRWNGHRCVRKD